MPMKFSPTCFGFNWYSYKTHEDIPCRVMAVGKEFRSKLPNFLIRIEASGASDEGCLGSAIEWYGLLHCDFSYAYSPGTTYGLHDEYRNGTFAEVAEWLGFPDAVEPK